MRTWRGILVLVAGFSLAAAAADQPVGITATLPYVDVVHDGKPFMQQRGWNAGRLSLWRHTDRCAVNEHLCIGKRPAQRGLIQMGLCHCQWRFRAKVLRQCRALVSVHAKQS